jgi:hypothetical protein
MESNRPRTTYHYFINLDERGEFFADVRNSRERSVLEIRGFSIFDDGFMSHKKDLTGLKDYLVSLRLMKSDWLLQPGNFTCTTR